MYLTLSVLIAPNQGLAGQLSHTFDASGGMIGRAPSCDFVLPDPNKTISGRHAAISYAAGRFAITDMSTNGTYFGPNGTPLKRGQSAAIENGVQIRIGAYTLVARLEAAPGQGRAPSYVGQPYPEPSVVAPPDTDLLGQDFSPRRSADTDPFGDLISSASGHRPGPAAPSGYPPAVAAPPTGFDDLIGRKGPVPQDQLLPGNPMGIRPASHHPQAPANYAAGDSLRGFAAPTGQGVPAGYDPYAQPRPAVPPGGADFVRPATAVPPTPIPIDMAVAMEDRSFPLQPPRPAPAAAPPQPAVIPDSFSLDDLLGPDTPAPAPRAGEAGPVAPVSFGTDPLTASPPVPDPLPLDPQSAAPVTPSGGGAAAAMPAVTPSPVAAPIATAPAAFPSPVPGPMPPLPTAAVPTTPPRDLAPQFKPDLVTLADDLAVGLGAARAGDERAKVLDPVSVLRARAKSRHSVLPDATLFGARTTPPATAEDGDAVQSLLAQVFSLSESEVASYSAEELRTALVEIVQAATDGIVQVLAARRLVKDEFRIENTRLQPDENNAFKFAKSGAEALRYMLDPKGGFLPPGRAVSEAFNELKAHEMAAIQAVQASLAVILGRLAPERIEAEAASAAPTSLIARASGTHGLWQRYRTVHGQLSEDLDRTTRQLVAEEFSRAYKAHLSALNGNGEA